MNIPDIFSDVDPIPQSDGPEPACAITYTPEFVEAHDYLRAVLKVDERSERAFDLTTICLKFNPANYTVWHYRRRCLAALCAPTDDGRATIDADRIDKDLDFADKLGGTNPKNYQLWYHRRALLEILFTEEPPDKRMQIAQKELDYVDKILNDDNKNYHAWSHRQWIIRTINQPQLWSAEIDYSHKKILLDPRNNSAWNQRWFATHEGQNARKLSFEKAEEEANYALCGAQVDPFNESPWRYLIGVFLEQWRLGVAQSEEEEEGAAHKDKVSNLLREYINKMKEMNKVWDDPPEDYPSGPCVSLISALVDLLETVGDKSSLEEAKTLMGELVEEDPVRRKYWQKRQNNVMSSLEKC